MTEDQTIKSKLKISTVLILIAGGVIFMVGGYYTTARSLQEEYPQIIGVAIGFLFGLFGFISIFSLLFINRYVLDKEKLVLKSIFNFPKKVVYIKDIVSFNEIEKHNNSGKWKVLTIFTKHHKVKITSSIVSNYTLFKNRLTSNKSRNEYSERLWGIRVMHRYGWGFLAFGVVFILLFLKIYTTPHKDILADQLTMVIGTVSEDLKINNEGRKRAKSIYIDLDQFPGFIFHISGSSFHASDSEGITSNISSGDEIQIDILSETNSKKLTKTEALTFWDKTINYNSIKIFGLRKDNREFLKLKSLNKEHKNSSTSFFNWILLIIGLTSITAGISFIIKKKLAASSKYNQADRIDKMRYKP